MLQPTWNRQVTPDSSASWLTTDALVSARAIHKQDDRIRWSIEAMLLTDMTIHEIARRVGVPADVVETYACIWFEVRDLRGQLKPHDWILAHVVLGHWDRSDPPESLIWKCVALSGGAVALEVLRGDSRGLTDKQIAQRRLQAAKARLAVKIDFAPFSNVGLWKRLLLEAAVLFPEDANADPRARLDRSNHLQAIRMHVGLATPEQLPVTSQQHTKSKAPATRRPPTPPVSRKESPSNDRQ